MASNSNIQWTESTWSPVTGCTRVSEGCRNCYAERLTATRLRGQEKYRGLAVINPAGEARWSGEIRLHPDALAEPLHWRKPRRVFVCSMSDLFHPDVPFEFIDRVFATMALCPQHTFQVLTKRPARMAEYFQATDRKYSIHAAMERLCSTLDDGTVPAKLDPLNGRKFVVPRYAWAKAPAFPTGLVWPLPGVWLGTSVGTQKSADEFIPHLLHCPARVRFLSVEPLIEAVDLRIPNPVRYSSESGASCWECGGPSYWREGGVIHPCGHTERRWVDWVIVGGESGPLSKVRPCNVEWIRSIVRQCKAAGVPCFVKQLGSKPAFDPRVETGSFHHAENGLCIKAMDDRKGGDIAEWPEDLRVREFPEIAE